MPVPPPLSSFLSQPIAVRRRARATLLTDLHPSEGLSRVLERSGLRRVGDLSGRRGQDLTWIEGMDSGRVKELHRRLVRIDALESVPRPQPSPAPATRTEAPGQRRAPSKVRPKRNPAAAIRSVPVRAFHIRPDKRHVRVDSLRTSTWLGNTLDLYGIRRLGDLDGRPVRALASLRRFGGKQVRELYELLAAQKALGPPPVPPELAVLGSRRAALSALVALFPNPLRREILAHAPPFAEIRFERFDVPRRARRVRVGALPATEPMLRALRRAGCVELGDLQGRTPADFIAGPTSAEVARQIYGLLLLVGAHEPGGSVFSVPRRLRGVAVEDFSMPQMLRLALRRRGVTKLGQIQSLTPAKLGAKFGRVRLEALEALVERMRTTRVDSVPFARAVDGALDQLSPLERKGILLRFGAKGRPLATPLLCRTLKVRTTKPFWHIEKWLARLKDQNAMPIGTALRHLHARTRNRRARIPADEVDRILGLTRSKPRYGRDFYVRLVPRLDPRIKVAVVWGKLRGSPRPRVP